MEIQNQPDELSVICPHNCNSSKQDSITRAPSPGMDINWHMGNDLQLWGYLHGYGDTAESIPDEGYDSPHGVSNGHSYSLKGIQARGWQ